jgi:hypothetical protein
MSGVVAQNINRQSGLIKAAEAGGGAWTFIKKLTASADGTLSFVNGSADVVLDSTYGEYLFYFVNMHPATNEADFSFNMSTDTGSNYNVSKTTTRISQFHKEDASTAGLTIHASSDLAEGTGFQDLLQNVGNDNDQSTSGYLHLFNPSSTTFVKHFISRGSIAEAGDYSEDNYTAGYGNTTSAVDAVQFKFDTGNVDTGDIFLHGLKI